MILPDKIARPIKAPGTWTLRAERHDNVYILRAPKWARIRLTPYERRVMQDLVWGLTPEEILARRQAATGKAILSSALDAVRSRAIAGTGSESFTEATCKSIVLGETAINPERADEAFTVEQAAVLAARGIGFTYARMERILDLGSGALRVRQHRLREDMDIPPGVDETYLIGAAFASGALVIGEPYRPAI